MTNMVDHARREMELIGEDPETIRGICKVVQAYFDVADSGGAHSILLPMLNELLALRNLSPLTNDPDEWDKHLPDMWDGEKPVWQNKRNSEAFSLDGGMTYWLLGEHEHAEDKIVHVSAPMKPRVIS